MQNISTVDGDKNGMKRRDSLTSHVSTNKSQNGDTDSAVGKVSSPKKAEEVESVEEVDDFVPSKHYDFRFSRQQLLDLKRGKLLLKNVDFISYYSGP